MTLPSTDTRVIVSDAPPRRGVRLRWIVFGAIALLLLGGALWIKTHPQQRAATAEHSAGRPPGAATMADRKLPVIVTSVAPKPFPVLLEGLGTVTPLATVTVKPQVEGRLLSITYQEGGVVRRGQLLAEIDPRPFRIALEQAKATLLRDRAQLENSQRDLERFESLRTRNLIAAQQLDAQRAQVAQQKAVIGIDQAQTDEAALNLDYTRITSPIDGIAGIRQVDPGNLLRTTDANGIVVLTQLDPIAVVFTVPQDELPRLAAAQAEGPRPVKALSRAGDQVLGEGKLIVIDNQINPSTGTVKLKAEFPNPKRALWPSQFVRARLEVTTYASALTLPAAAVQSGPKGQYVYVVGPDDVARMRPVKLGLLQGDQALISEGLSPGERIVVEGQDQIKPNSQVEPRDADGGGAPPGAQAGRDGNHARPAAHGGGQRRQ